MSIIKKSFIAGFIFVSFANAITLQDIIQIAKENNPVLKQRYIDIKIQESVEKQVKAKKFGEVDVFGSYNRYEGSRVLYPMSTPIDPKSIVGAKNQFITGISYTVPIFTGFQIEKSIEIADLEKTLKESQYKLTKNEIIYNIKTIYIKILSLKKQEEAFKTYKESLQELYKNINEMVKLGKKPEIDLLKVQYDLENVEATIKKIENNIDSLKEALKSLAGREEIDLSNIEDINLTKDYPEVESLEAIKSLDAIQQILIKEKIGEKKVQTAKSDYYPQVFLQASAQRNMGNGEYKDLWQLSLNVKYDIFDFGRRKYSYIENKLNLSKTKQEERSVALSLISKIKDALNQIKTAEAQIKAREKQVSFAKELESTEKAKYEEGVSDLYDYLYAKSQFYIAKSSYYEALYDRETAISYLKYLLEEFKYE